MSQELGLSVLICSRGRGCSTVVDHHLNDEGIIRLLLVSSEILKELGKVIRAVLTEEP